MNLVKKYQLHQLILLFILLFSATNGQCVEDEEVLLWDNCYNISETTNLNLEHQNLEGEIPYNLWQLINLDTLDLSDNLLTGQISHLIGNNLSKGSHQFDFNGENLSSGTYFIQINSGQNTEIRKVLLIK